MFRLDSSLAIDVFWPQLVERRRNLGSELPFSGQNQQRFWWVLTEAIKSGLGELDRLAHFDIFQAVSKDKEFEAALIFNALVDEAFFSSAIEGAFSTKQRTQAMIRQQQIPRNKSKQMIINNYRALEYALENILAPIDEDMILSIYKLVVEGTLTEEDIVTKYRDDYVYVLDDKDRVIYTPPQCSEVQALMDDLIAFINTPDDFHPIVKASIIHFLILYIHPFFDGNGRTARAVSYMYLLKAGYNLLRFFSISSMVNGKKNQYYKAIKDCEDYGSDLTYFIDFYVSMLIDSVTHILDSTRQELAGRLIAQHLRDQQIVLNKRQQKAIAIHIKGNKQPWEVSEYQKRFKTSYETGRTDLNQLVEHNIFTKTKTGKKYVYQLAGLSELMGK